MSCRRVNDIACAKCSRQKQIWVSICLRFIFFWRFFSNNSRFLFDLEMRLSSWLTLESRCEMRSLRQRFFNVSVLFFVCILRRERESDSIEKTSTK
jgi:hypothetical protein